MRKLFTALSLLLWAYVAATTAPPPTVPLGRTLSPQDIDEAFRAELHAKKVLKAVQQARTLFKRVGCRRDYSPLVGQYAVSEGMNPRIAAALIFVESSCNPKADDHLGSHGLMQVNTHTHPYNKRQMQDPEQNIRAGMHILAGYIHRYGLVEGLHHYNGMGNPSEDYALKVLAVAGVKA